MDIQVSNFVGIAFGISELCKLNGKNVSVEDIYSHVGVNKEQLIKLSDYLSWQAGCKIMRVGYDFTKDRTIGVKIGLFSNIAMLGAELTHIAGQKSKTNTKLSITNIISTK